MSILGGEMQFVPQKFASDALRTSTLSQRAMAICLIQTLVTRSPSEPIPMLQYLTHSGIDKPPNQTLSAHQGCAGLVGMG